MNLLCMFGHDKEYIAIGDVDHQKRCMDVGCCGDLYHKGKVRAARWICKRCPKMGQEHLPTGAWMVEFGKLVPDRKAWSNFDDQTARSVK